LDINQQIVSLNNLLPTAIILLIYFIGKFQQKQKQVRIMGTISNELFQEPFNLSAEIILIAFSIILFVSFLYYPQLAFNGIAIWFRESIIDLETTVLIGFIFKIIGFFFLISMLIKMMNALLFILSGKPLLDINTFIQRGNRNREKEDFDDYEEIK